MSDKSTVTKFLLEIDHDGYMEELPNSIRLMVNGVNWWNAGDPSGAAHAEWDYAMATLEAVDNSVANVKDVVPVGSLEFCQAVSEAQRGPVIGAMNIPVPLRSEEFIGRNVFDTADLTGLRQLLRLSEPMLVKPGDTPKRFDAVSVTETSAGICLANVDGPFFASELLQEDILAEWRVFFSRGRIVSARPYTLPVWKAPDLEFTEEAIFAWSQSGTMPAAGTLDIAILESGRNVVIEAHQFIACALYGFEGEDVLRMLSDAWRWHLSIG